MTRLWNNKEFKLHDYLSRASSTERMLDDFGLEKCPLWLIWLLKVNVGKGKVGHRRAEDGRLKMGAHEAGRVACHASSPEWAVKSATRTFPFDFSVASFI